MFSLALSKVPEQKCFSKQFFRWFVSNGLRNIIPKETSDNAGAKSPKIRNEGIATWLDDALRVPFSTDSNVFLWSMCFSTYFYNENLVRGYLVKNKHVQSRK